MSTKTDLSDKRFMLLFGPPGCGKNFLVELMREEGLVLKHVSAGEILRQKSRDPKNPIGSMIAEMQKHGEHVPTDIVMKAVFDDDFFQTREDLIVLDGFPRNEDQANALFEKFVFNPDKLIGVHINRAENRCLKNIMKSESRGLGVRNDDHEEVIRRRYQLHFAKTYPAIMKMMEKGMSLYETGDVEKLEQIIPHIFMTFETLYQHQIVSADFEIEMNPVQV